jgi:hypothetical protein
MNLLQLKELIERSETLGYRASDIEVVIPIELDHHSVGGTPCCSIERSYFGFDWDKNKLFLVSSKKLTSADEDAIAKSKKQYDTIGKMDYEMKGLKKQIKDLKATIGRLTSKGNDEN